MKRVFSGVSGHVISIVLRSGPRSIQNSVSQQGGWATGGRPRHTRAFRVGRSPEKSTPDCACIGIVRRGSRRDGKQCDTWSANDGPACLVAVVMFDNIYWSLSL